MRKGSGPLYGVPGLRVRVPWAAPCSKTPRSVAELQTARAPPRLPVWFPKTGIGLCDNVVVFAVTATAFLSRLVVRQPEAMTSARPGVR